MGNGQRLVGRAQWTRAVVGRSDDWLLAASQCTVAVVGRSDQWLVLTGAWSCLAGSGHRAQLQTHESEDCHHDEGVSPRRDLPVRANGKGAVPAGPDGKQIPRELKLARDDNLPLRPLSPPGEALYWRNGEFRVPRSSINARRSPHIPPPSPDRSRRHRTSHTGPTRPWKPPASAPPSA